MTLSARRRGVCLPPHQAENAHVARHEGQSFSRNCAQARQLRRADGHRSGEFPRIAGHRRLHLRSICSGLGASRPALIIGTPNAPWLKPSLGDVQKPEITTWSDNHPVMQYVSVHDVAIERRLANRSGRFDSDCRIQTDAADRRVRQTQVGHADLRSAIRRTSRFHVGFPVFIDNVLVWFSREQLAIKRSPGVVDVPLPNAQIRTIDGKTIPSEQQLGKTVFQASDPDSIPPLRAMTGFMSQ